MPVTVEVEKDLSLKPQRLDVVIIRKDSSSLPCRLPDGFDDLGPHNLITFKSYQEALDGWTLHELCGHYANYRKQVSPSMQNLLPESDFRLFAVSVRYPQKLAQQVTLTETGLGTYDVRHFSGSLRLVVVHQLPREEQNAMLHLFSAQVDLVKYGAEHYRQRSGETTSLLRQLYERYQHEGLSMSYTMADLVRETIDELVKTHPDEILQKLPVEKRLEGLSAEKRLEGLSAEELMNGIPRETLEALFRQFKEKSPSPDSN